MSFIRRTLKKILPETWLKKIRPLGHGFLAYWAAFWAGFPSRRLIIIGVTGTAGKSTTVQMLSSILNANNCRTGYTTTTGYFDGKKERLNKVGLSMPSGFLLQRFLKGMVTNGCRYAIIECTSEGLAQNRHLGINFDLALLTNIAEAHIEAHGNYFAYKQAKLKLFKLLARQKKKTIFPNKVIGINYFVGEGSENFYESCLSQPADRRFIVSKVSSVPKHPVDKVYLLKKEGFSESENKFSLADQVFELLIPGKFNYANAALAAAAANFLGISLTECASALRDFSGVAGRMQEINNHKGIKIILDYAPEPLGMRNVLGALKSLSHRKIIHVFGSTGGHRDASKRFEFGRISAKVSDTVIITNDDVYDSDPEKIAQDIEKGIDSVSNRQTKNVYKILDRRQAIKKALEIAEKGDLVIFTGKGSEQFLVLPGNKRIDWDEKSVIESFIN